jgi:predicted ribosome quality control (RQC) complex YloA/Tae2 family protein
MDTQKGNEGSLPEAAGTPGRKQEMSSLDLRFVVKELRQEVTGGVVRKIYQYGRAGSRQFLFEVWVPKKGSHWLYFDNSRMFLTKHKKASPQEPPSFCMFLRKHMMGKKIKSIRQYEFDRIVEIATDENVLIIELFSTGNVILCDSMYSIIMPLEFQKWKGREVNPFKADFDSLRMGIARSDKNLTAYLATVLGLGPDYAREVCMRAGTEPEKACKDVALDEASRINNAMASLDNEKPDPSVYPGFVSPFRLMILKDVAPKTFTTMSEAFDEFFSDQEINAAKEGAVTKATEERERVERIVDQQEEAGDKWKRIIRESQERGNLIYSHYPTVQAALEGISKARASGMEWDEIKKTIGKEQTPEAESIKEIREGDGLVVLDLGGKEVEIVINKSVEDNAARYYEDAKWAKKKLEGLGEASGDFQEKLVQAEKSEESVLGDDFKRMVFPKEKASETEVTEEETEKPRKARKRWYENFRWFFSSDGLLVVAGKSAESNEALLKKHTDPSDMVFHADIPGAAFVVIKSQGLDITDVTKREAAEFAAAHSKAWARGLGTIDIFSVPRERVSKTPPSGQYLPKGSFMVTGEREWYRNLELKLALGIKIDRESKQANVVSGPVMAVRKHTDYFITMKPGFKKSLELSRLIKNKILVKARPDDRYIIEQIPLDELQVAIPSGMADVVEHAGEAV